MKFRCERDTLSEVLGSAGRAASTGRGTLSVLGCLKLALEGQKLTVTGTDLDLTIVANVTVAGEEDGEAAIPAKLAFDLVRSLDSGAIDIVTDGDEAVISQDRSRFSVRLSRLEEFPQLGEPAAESITLDAEAFAEGLKQVVKAASNDDSRPILTGVLLAAEAGGLRLVSTDSYRLAVRDLPGTSVLAEGQQVIVPSRALKEVERLLASGGELTLRLGERSASFQVGDTRLSTQLIEGAFPDYQKLIPATQPNRVVMQRDALIDAVKRMKLMAREPATPVRLHFQTDAVQLEAVTLDVGTASGEIDAKYEGTEMTVAFNPDYLLEGLEVTPGDEVSIETVDALKPALLRSTESTDYLYLLMPVRVS